MVLEYKTLSSKKTQDFAEIFCGDFNPIHAVSAGKRQIVPGDWQIYYYLNHFNHSFAFPKKIVFENFLKPEIEFELNETEIYLPKPNLKCITRFSDTTGEDFESCLNQDLMVSLGNTKNSIIAMESKVNKFGSKANAALLLNFLQASRDIGQVLLAKYFGLNQDEFSKKVLSKEILPFYQGAKFDFDPMFNIMELSELERMVLEPEQNSVVVKGNKKREVISFPFVLLKNNDTIVGHFRKNLLISYRI